MRRYAQKITGKNFKKLAETFMYDEAYLERMIGKFVVADLQGNNDFDILTAEALIDDYHIENHGNLTTWWTVFLKEVPELHA